ncbi:MAG: MFS transporter [Chloroflexi bacterium]|nr:MFS transporter [Chloroflexota bacterium]
MESDGPRTSAAYRNLSIYLAGQALSNIGSFSQVVALSLLVLDLSDSALALGATMSVQAIPQLLLSPWAGPLLDRVPLRRLLLVTALVGVLQAASLAVLALTGQIAIPWVIGLAFMGGCVQVFDRPAVQAFLGELVPRSNLHRAVSLASSVQAFGRLGGPALAGVLYAWRGAGLVFAVNAASFFLVIAALLALRDDAMFPREHRAVGGGRLMEAVRYAWKSPTLGPILLGNVIVGLFAFNFPTFFATLSTLTFQQPELFGIAESVNAVAAVLMGIVLARWLHVPTMRIVGLACAAFGVTLVLVALAPTPTAFILSMPFFGAAVVAYTATAQSLAQRQAPREMVGRMMSLYTLGSMGTTPLGGLIVGLVSDSVSPRAAVGMGAVSAILVGLALALRVGAQRDASALAHSAAPPGAET